MLNKAWNNTEIVWDIINSWRFSDFEKKHRSFLCSEWLNKKISPEHSVIEIGCGAGLIYQQLTTSNYIGLDYSYPMLSYFKKSSPNTKLIQGDIYNLPFKDKGADRVICIDVLSHLEDGIVQPISELLRITKGSALFTLWSTTTTRDIRIEVSKGSVIPYWGYAKEAVEHILYSLVKTNYKIIEFEKRRMYGVVGDFCTSLAIEMWR